MGKKNEKSKNAAEAAMAITNEIEKILAKHGFVNHKLTKFSMAPILAESPNSTVSNCPPNYHREWICRTINGVTNCGWECIKDK